MLRVWLTFPDQVGDLKKKIQESQTFPAENQKLIYSGQCSSCRISLMGWRTLDQALTIAVTGKILNDSATVSSLKVKEKDFLVVMVSKVGSSSHMCVLVERCHSRKLHLLPLLPRRLHLSSLPHLHRRQPQNPPLQPLQLLRLRLQLRPLHRPRQFQFQKQRDLACSVDPLVSDVDF